MSRSKIPVINISIANGALESIFDECDQYNVDETGGRLIGNYQQKGARYDIQVLGVLEPGPNATRSPTSLFQDGDYQERIFRLIEESHPNVEHLGNWHTHHVNGYPTLSGGDHTTYFKTVNHKNHNTGFFYALLVTRRTPGGNMRYEFRHYLFRRDQETVYEIPAEQVQLVDIPVLWPLNAKRTAVPSISVGHLVRESLPNLERAKDQELFAEFYPNLKAMLSKSLAAAYWKGSLELVDGSHVNVVAVEISGEGPPSYSITFAGESSILVGLSASYQERRFRSARHAVLHLEKDLNQAIYRHMKG